MDNTRIVEVCALDLTMDKLLRELNTELIEQGYELVGVCSQGILTRKLLNEGFNIVNINIDRSIKPISNLKSIVEMYRLFRKTRPQIVHVHTPIAAVLGRISAKLARAPIIVYTAHGFYFHENMNPFIYWLTVNIEKLMAKYLTDFIFTQSEEDAKTAVAYKFKSENKILAIGNGVDIWGRFNPENINKEDILKTRRDLNIKDDDKVITFIGRLVKEKGILDILKAFTKLNDSSIKLLVVGDSVQGDRDIEIGKLLNEYKKCENIIFTGVRDDINKILYFTDIFCLPSYREGMPRSIIEAMAMNCAVIATNIRGSREEVVDGQTGFLVEVRDWISLKDKIKKLLCDDSLLQSIKEKGRIRAEELYDEKLVVRRQLNVFEKLLNDYKSR